jgi:DNA-binding transcriptional ArsR family regulator
LKSTTHDTGIDQRIVKAISHPLRARLLAILNQKVASPNELAKETGEPLGNVSYHVRLLADLECVELVRTAPRRGAVEHYYQAVVPAWFDKASWAKLPASVRDSFAGTALSFIVDEAAASMRSGAFESRDDVHVSRAPLMLDDEGWRELAGLLDEVLERALQLKAESANRAVENNTEDELIPCSLGMMHFPTARAS